jgi:uncharacterized protein (TIGR02996 family)
MIDSALLPVVAPGIENNDRGGEPQVTDHAAFLAAIDAAPGDDLPKLVYADYLDERGDARGTALRWVVDRRVAPILDATTGTWDWWGRPPAEPDYYPDPAEVHRSILPPPLFRRLKGKRSDVWKGYRTYSAALNDLLRAWARCVADGRDPLGK